MKEYFSSDFLLSLPEPFVIPRPWPYGKKWIAKNIDSCDGREIIDEACGIPGSAEKISEFFVYVVPRALEKIAIQNSLISQILGGKVEAHKLSKSDVDWQMGNTWARIFEHKAVLFEAYNAGECVGEVFGAINLVWSLFGSAREHAEKIISYIECQSSEFERVRDEGFLRVQTERENRSNDMRIERQSVAEKWQAIDVDHSKIECGFLYVLSNDLMPGVYKIGFTSGNPDKRAAQISRQYGLPSPFCVVRYWRTADPYIVEQRIHAFLSAKNKSGEFFEVNFEELVKIIEGFLIREA